MIKPSIVRFLLLSALYAAAFPAIGQDTLTRDDFIRRVGEHHPISIQAGLRREAGSETVKKARGGFDPVLYGRHSGKEFQETNYYQKQNLGIHLPTFGGLEINADYERNLGTYLNPELTETQGIFAAGVRWNIGQGLMIDQRRADLRKAQQFLKETEEQRLVILNDLYTQAISAYWEWARAHADYRVYSKAYELALERFEAVKGSYRQGDLPAIDTVEAYTQVQAREVSLKDAENKLFTARQEVSTFTWDEGITPLEINENVTPEQLENQEQPDLREKADLLQALENHPLLKRQDYRIEQSKVERRWRAEQLKPRLYLQYNYLTDSPYQAPETALFTNNYTFGAGFSSPLFLRRERGRLNLTDIQIREQSLQRTDTYVVLKAELESVLNTYEIKLEQLQIFKSNVLNLNKLLDAERTKFQLGESSLFLINAREISYIDAQTILNDLRSAVFITEAELKNAVGTAWQELED